MALNIKTDNETECRYLNISESENLYFLIYRSEYKSYFPFAYNDQSGNGRFIGYAGAICSTDINDDSFDDSFPKDVDLYICPNGMKTQFKRTSDQLINLQNLVIDIDSHNSSLSINELQNHINVLKDKLLEKMKIKPNFINLTGRGMHLWFCIEPCHVSLDKICLNVIDMICNHIKDIMKSINEIELTIDRTSSLRLNGLFRVPYSYNTKAEVWSKGYMIHEETPNIINLYQELKDYGFKGQYFGDAKPKTKKFKKHQPNYIKDIKHNDYTPCLIHRKKFIEHLWETRTIESGSRDIMLFATYTTMIKLFNIEDAREYCSTLNDQLSSPLPYGELLNIFKEVEKKKHKFTVEKFFAFVSATQEEIAWFNKATVKEERKQQKREAKNNRNNRIIELYNNGVRTIDIANELKISKRTVERVIKNIV